MFAKIGVRLLLLIFLCLLMGRFTLDRLVPSWPALDLRLAGGWVTATVFLIWQFGARHERHARVTAQPLLAFFLGWCGWLAISASWSPPLAGVAENLLDMGLLSAFVTMAALVAARLSSEAVDSLWLWTLLAGLTYLVSAVAAGPGDQGRYAAFGGGPNIFVRVMVLAAIAALYLYMTGHTRWVLLAIPLFAIGAIFSGSRGGLLACAVVTLVGLFPLARHLGSRRVVGLLLGGSAATWAAMLFTGQDGIKFIQERFVQQTLVTQYTSGRGSLYGDAIDLFKSSPLTGVGLDGFYGLRGIYTDIEYPHNLFLATAAEGGMIGVLLLVVAIAAGIVIVRRQKPMSLRVLFLLLAGTYLFVAGQFSGDYYDSRLMWFFLFLAAVEAKKRKPSSSCPAALPVKQALLR